MVSKWTHRFAPPIVALAVSLCCALLSPAFAERPSPTPAEAIWASETTAALKLTAAQRPLFQVYAAALHDLAGEQTPLTIDQIAAMTAPERMSVLADRAMTYARLSKASADAAARLYAALTLRQREMLDKLTAPSETGRLAPAQENAAGVWPGDKPNYQLPSHTAPDWLVMPRPEDLNRVYPARARNLRIGGEARLRCTADWSGYLANCEVISETPADFGFGNAALEVTGYMRMKPATEYGAPVEATVVVPVAFKLPNQ